MLVAHSHLLDSLAERIKCQFDFAISTAVLTVADRLDCRFLGSLGRDSLYHQIRSSACTPGMDEQTVQDAMDLAMREFGRGVVQTVGSEVDRLETELKSMVPGLVYVDLETDKGRSEQSAAFLSTDSESFDGVQR